MTARTSLVPYYSEIVRQNFEELASVEKRIRSFDERIAKSNGPDELLSLEFERMPLEHDLAKYALVVVVFAIISIEAYLYDYAARNLTDKYVQEYIDKLDVIGKLVIIPRLITGKELPRHRKWFGLVKNIVKARNMIVHSKSSNPPINVEEAQQYFSKQKEKADQIMQAAWQSVELLETLVLEISGIDPGELPWIRSYFSHTSQI